MVAFDAVRPRVLGYLTLRPGAMPQDVRLSPDGTRFFVADMTSDGVWVIDARRLRKIGFVRTGRGAHGIYPSRDARVLYVSNRGEGSISVLSAATGRPLKKWWLPGGGSHAHRQHALAVAHAGARRSCRPTLLGGARG